MYNRENQEINLVWTTRFITAAITQGAIVVGLTFFIIFREILILEPGVSRVIATGEEQTHGLLLAMTVLRYWGKWCCSLISILFIYRASPQKTIQRS